MAAGAPAAIGHGVEETSDEGNALLASAVFLQQEMAEVLLEAIDHLKGRKGVEVGLEFGLLLWLEMATMSAHQREQAAVLAGGRIDAAPTSQEVVVDEADDVEAN
jgi:hypothetical protein